MEIDLNLLKIQNPWWDSGNFVNDEEINNFNQAKFKYRPSIIDKIKLKKGSRIVVEGARGLGKTTLFKLLLSDLIKKNDPGKLFYYSCHNLNSKEQLNEIIKKYLSKFAKSGVLYIFIDEVAQVKDWHKGIEYLNDAGLLDNVSLVVGGSHFFSLDDASLKWQRYLLHSLSFKEMLNLLDDDLYNELLKNKQSYRKYYNRIEYYLDIYMLTGGYLQVINDFFKKGHVSQEVYDKHIYWVIADVAKDKKDLVLFRQIIEQIFHYFGTNIGSKTLARLTVAKTHNTVLEYLNLLKNLFLTQDLFQLGIDQNINKRANRRLYFRDPFLYWLFLSYSYASLNCWYFSREYIHKKKIFDDLAENVVFSHLLKQEDYDTWEKVVFNKKISQDIFAFVSKNNTVLLDYEEKYKKDFFKKKISNKGIIISRKKLDLETSIKIMPLSYFLIFS